jgi:hypothetical protein
VLGIQAVRLLGKARVQEALAGRVQEAVAKVQGAATPEEVIQVLSDHLRGGRFFKVDAGTGEPVIDLRAMEEAGQLHLVKKVTKSGSSSSGADTSSESKNIEVELYSSQEAAAILARIYGMEKRRPEEHSPLADARKLVLAIFESEDERAYQQFRDLARRVLPGPPA